MDWRVSVLATAMVLSAALPGVAQQGANVSREDLFARRKATLSAHFQAAEQQRRQSGMHLMQSVRVEDRGAFLRIIETFGNGPSRQIMVTDWGRPEDHDCTLSGGYIVCTYQEQYRMYPKKIERPDAPPQFVPPQPAPWGPSEAVALDREQFSNINRRDVLSRTNAGLAYARQYRIVVDGQLMQTNDAGCALASFRAVLLATGSDARCGIWVARPNWGSSMRSAGPTSSSSMACRWA